MNEPSLRKVAPGVSGADLEEKEEDVAPTKNLNDEQRKIRQREYSRRYAARKKAAARRPATVAGLLDAISTRPRILQAEDETGIVIVLLLPKRADR